MLLIICDTIARLKKTLYMKVELLVKNLQLNKLKTNTQVMELV